MAPGVGKTRAMMQAAQKERLAGRDVVIGCLADTELAVKGTLVKNLSPVSRKSDGGASTGFPADLDLAAVLTRRPDVAVVDELAHQNPPPSKHSKRYQDVTALLEAGIDVLTTLNIGQVASRTDDVGHIIGTVSGEVVPDTILDVAELELVDLPPRELLKRTSRGDVRLAPAEAAKWGLLNEGRLVALRELTVRLFAERAGQDANNFLARAQPSEPARSGQRLLAVVQPGCESEPVVRWTRRLADTFHCPWIVLYVEDSRFLRGKQQAHIAKVLEFARELGAEVITVPDKDPVAATLRIAAQRNVTQIVVGKPGEAAGRKFFRRDRFALDLLQNGGEVGFQFVPVNDGGLDQRHPLVRNSQSGTLAQYLKAIGAIAAVTLAAFLFTPFVGPHTTALVFLLTVVLLALFVSRGPTLVAAVMSAVSWVYFFLPPPFAFRIEHFEDAMLSGMYIVVALVLGHLTTRIRAQEAAEREREGRATALYLLTRELNESVSLDQMIQRIVRQLKSSFDAEVAVFTVESGQAPAPHAGSTLPIPSNERELPEWVVKHRQRAGKFTHNQAFATAIYVPLLTTSGLVGVLALRLNQPGELTLQQDHLLDAFSQQIAMALDRHRLNGVSERAKLLAESERLSKTLLDSMSHEIRTPIAAIKSATGNLAELPAGDTRMRQEMIEEIQEATERLNRLVGNIIEASRLESGAVVPRLNECDLGELIHVALADVEKELSGHKVTVRIQPGLPVVPMDFVLMQQAVTNLLSNAALHTRPGTAVEVVARLSGQRVIIWVGDRGAGIPPESLPRIFDKFYRVPNSRTGGTGLGLSLVKGFVEAQGGEVTAENRPGGGTAFTISLPRPAATPVPEEARS